MIELAIVIHATNMFFSDVHYNRESPRLNQNWKLVKPQMNVSHVFGLDTLEMMSYSFLSQFG
jgi:hypothetical protein